MNDHISGQLAYSSGQSIPKDASPAFIKGWHDEKKASAANEYLMRANNVVLGLYK